MRKKPQQLIHGMNPSQQQMILDLIGVGAKLNPPQPPGIFNLKPIIEPIFPQGPTYFNQSIFQNFKPQSQLKNSVFSSMLDHQQSFKRQQYGGLGHPQVSQFSQLSTQYHPGGMHSQSASPQKKGRSTHSNHKTDINQCLDIQRLESNRKDLIQPPGISGGVAGKSLPGSQPGGILNQHEILKKPQTAGGGFRHHLVHRGQNVQKHRQIVGRSQLQSHQHTQQEKMNHKDHMRFSVMENPQAPSFAARMSVNGQNIEPSQTCSHIISGTGPSTVNQSIVLLGGGVLKDQSNQNSSRVDAYHQFQEFKERFIQDQLSTKNNQKINASFANRGSCDSQDQATLLTPRNMRQPSQEGDQSKFLKNLLQANVSEKDLQQKKALRADHVCKQGCDCQNPTSLLVSNLMRSRLDNYPQQPTYAHILPSQKQESFLANGGQHLPQVPKQAAAILARTSGARSSVDNTRPSNQQEYAQQIISAMKTSNSSNQRNTNQANAGSAPSIGATKATMDCVRLNLSEQQNQFQFIDQRKKSTNPGKVHPLIKQIDTTSFPDIDNMLKQQHVMTPDKSPQSHRSSKAIDAKGPGFSSFFDRKKDEALNEQKNNQILRSAPKHLRRSQNLKKAMVAYSKLSQLEQQLRYQADPNNPMIQIYCKQMEEHLSSTKYGGSPDRDSLDRSNKDSQKQLSKNSRQQSQLGDKSQQSFRSGVLAHQYPIQHPQSVKHNQGGLSKNSTIIERDYCHINDSQIIEYNSIDQSAVQFIDLEVQMIQDKTSHTKSRDNGLLQPVLSKSRGSKHGQQTVNEIANSYAGVKVPSNNRASVISNQTAGLVIPKKSKAYQMSQLQSEKISPSKKKQGCNKPSLFENKHKNHKINQVINMANEFLQETFLRTNDQPLNVDRVRFICQTFFGVKLPRNFSLEPGAVKSKDFQIQAKERILQRLYEVINQENGVPFDWINSQQHLAPRKFYVGKGNNYPLVRSILKQRWWWQTCQDGEDFDQCNFIWTSWRKNELIDYLKPINDPESSAYNNHDGKLRLYNRMEDNFHLSNKKALFFNMTQFYTQLGQDPFAFLPLTFHIEHGLGDPEFQKFKQYFASLEEERVLKQKLLSAKKKEYVHEKRKAEGYGSEDDVGSIGEEDEEYYMGDIEDIEEHFGISVPKNIWIMKPGENSNRGNGIFVCSTIREIVKEMNSSDKVEHTHIIQKYIEKPLLIHNRKFDIRVYGMLTSTFGTHKGYFYEDGYIRTSSVEFDLEDLGNRFIHLTNDAVQKKSDDYGKFENGNKVSYQNFQKYIDTHMPVEKRVNFHRDILPQIRKIISDTFKATFFLLDQQRRAHTFEIFGYDFMIDANFKVYLIEANTNPCLELSCPLLARIIPAMLDSAFRIALDPLFPPRAERKNANTLPELLPVNKWELVFDERLEGDSLREAMRGLEAFNLKIDKNEECGDGGDESDDQKDCGEGGKRAHSDPDLDGSDEVQAPLRHAKTVMGVVRGGNNK